MTKPDLRVFFQTGQPLYPGLPFTLEVMYLNWAYTVAGDARVTVDVPRALAVRPLTEGCTVSGTRVTCAVGDLAPFEATPARLKLEIIAPDESAATFAATAEIESPTGEEVPPDNRFSSNFRTYRTFFVTNTSDSGDGSLRLALQTANSSCNGNNPCLVAFRIPEVAGVATIRPETPLPHVTAENLFIDGLSQARYFADSNPAGPEIELRGSALSEGDGLVMAVPCAAVVQGLAINGFPRHGIYTMATPPCPFGTAASGSHQVRQNYLGVDATGTTAVPNLRGIYSDASVRMMILENVISGNARAGVFIVSGTAFVTANTIGLDATGTKPLGNGASGIYFAAAARGSDATRNHIAFNTEAGVAIHPAAQYVNVYHNAIHANGQLAVDFGLDGPTPSVPITAPEIASARYDAATNTTTIIPRLTPDRNWTWVDMYANDAPDPSGYGEGQTYLGMATFRTGGQYQLDYRGDLRGKWIAGQGILQIITTFSTHPPVRSDARGPFADTTSSEFGRSVQVTP